MGEHRCILICQPDLVALEGPFVTAFIFCGTAGGDAEESFSVVAPRMWNSLPPGDPFVLSSINCTKEQKQGSTDEGKDAFLIVPPPRVAYILVLSKQMQMDGAAQKTLFFQS